MGDSPLDFQGLMRRVQQGSQEAAREVLMRYGPHVIRVIRRRLSKALRPRFDSADFSQSVWASFFAATSRDRTFEGPEALVAYLAETAHHKLIDATRQRLGLQKCNIFGEIPLATLPENRQPPEPAARQPTPSQLVMAEEQWDHLRANLSVGCQRMLELLREGYTHKEVGQYLGVHEKTVQRFLRLVAHRVGAR